MSSTATAKQVTFGDITIKEYDIVLGDHPNVSGGAPIQIGWDVQDVHTRNLDLYEVMRGDRRKGKKQLAIPVQKRGHMLLKAGYTLEDIGNAALAADEMKRLRQETIKNQGWDRANIVLETTGKLPNQIMGGFANLLSVKPRRKTIQARSA